MSDQRWCVLDVIAAVGCSVGALKSYKEGWLMWTALFVTFFVTNLIDYSKRNRT